MFDNSKLLGRSRFLFIHNLPFCDQEWVGFLIGLPAGSRTRQTDLARIIQIRQARWGGIRMFCRFLFELLCGDFFLLPQAHEGPEDFFFVRTAADPCRMSHELIPQLLVAH